METDKITIVDYSDKAFAVAAEYDTALLDEFRIMGGRFNPRLKFGAGRIFSKKQYETQLLGLFTAYGIAYVSVMLSDIASGSGNNNSHGHNNGKLPDYITTDKNNVIVALADGGTFTINNCKIKTEFWFGYSDCGQGPTSAECYADADKARTDESYFISENLSDLQYRLDWLMGDTEGRARKYLWLVGDGSGVWSLDASDIDPDSTNAVDCLHAWERNKYNQGLYKPLDSTNRERLIAAYRHAITLREKRCQAYLKRYGLNKIKVSTYWMDR